MSKKDYIRYVVNGVAYISYPEIEQKVKNDLFELYGPDAIVECRDYNSGVLLEELPLNVLFNEPRITTRDLFDIDQVNEERGKV